MATPQGLCEELPGSVTRVAAAPGDAAARAAYAEAVGCFVSRGVRYPAEWWDRVSSEVAERSFVELLGGKR
ncbi:MAG: hypothetical protein FJ104_09265 [Deltaproteobacteria bacterium]|nr:hypothetical protein [Deltaproteobacteria bacterium]